MTDTKPTNYVMAFLESVYPGNAELVAASFNEKAVLGDATALIGKLRSALLDQHRPAPDGPTDLEKARPLLEWAEKADASLLAHITTARLKDKCQSCDKAKNSIIKLADILSDKEPPMRNHLTGKRREQK